LVAVGACAAGDAAAWYRHVFIPLMRSSGRWSALKYSAVPNRHAPESSPRDEHAETHYYDVQGNDVGFAAHDVERDRQAHDHGQSDSGQGRQARHDTRACAQDETDTGGEFRKANESDM
jgi:hypothetical protein